MRVCAGDGTGRNLVCPYHQWTYDLDGSLLGAGGIDAETRIDRAELGLRQAHAFEVGGLVFACLSDKPPTFETATSELQPMLAPQGLDRARVAVRLSWRVAADWKLVWENNRECWHCHLGHPDYIRANFDIAPDSAAVREELALCAARIRANGFDVDHPETGLARFPLPGRWWSANRTPLVDGFVTESLDGARVCTLLMGSYPAEDVGTLRIRAVPSFWCHASCDHAVTTRIWPAGPRETGIEVCWLVHDDAEDGRDFDLERLLPFWQRTSEQDWALCERNQEGVSDHWYEPGPLSPSRESNVIAFLDWYLDSIGD
jgi:Rieske 2Fe-2S family protein